MALPANAGGASGICRGGIMKFSKWSLAGILSTTAILVGMAVLADDGGSGGSSSGQKGPGTSGQQFGQDSSGGGSQGGGHDSGHDDDHDDGHDSGHDDGHDSGHMPVGGSGQGQSGQGQGQGGDVKPVWAQEGIPEVELGRLNVARSPTQVLDRAYDEALATFTPGMATFYNLTLDQMVLELSGNWQSVEIVDSPLQNLALFRDALGGSSVLSSKGVSNSNDTLLAAFLGTASDKGMPVLPETAYAVSMILGQPISVQQAAALAADAERIRIAILAGHG